MISPDMTTKEQKEAHFWLNTFYELWQPHSNDEAEGGRYGYELIQTAVNRMEKGESPLNGAKKNAEGFLRKIEE